MNEINNALSDADTFFLVFAALAVTVTGFYLGLRWLERMDDRNDPDNYS